MIEVNINGVSYKEIPTNKTNTVFSKYLLEMMALSVMCNPTGFKKPQKRYELSDLIKEFELIQRKQSKLSRKDRDDVVRMFNKYFEKI